MQTPAGRRHGPQAVTSFVRPAGKRHLADPKPRRRRDAPAPPVPREAITLAPAHDGVVVEAAGRAATARLLARVNDLTRANAALAADLADRERSLAQECEARERLSQALDGSRLAHWDHDILSGRLYLSERWATMMGLAPGETHTTLAAMFESTHPDERADLLARYTAAVKGSATEYVAEHRVRTSTGDWIWVLSHGTVAERAKDGRAVRIIGTNADITDRKRAEFALERRMAELRLVQDHAPVMIAYFDGDQHCRYANRKYAAFYGKTPEQVIGLHASDILGADFAAIEHHCAYALAGYTVKYERAVTRDDRERHITVELVPFDGLAGHKRGYYVISSDITERRRAEDQIRVSEQRFRDVVEASGEYIWETDAQWRYRYLSKRAESVLGHPIAELVGRKPSDFMPDDERPRVARWLAANMPEGGAFTDLEHRTVTAGGETVWQWVSGKAVRDDAGRIVAYRGTGANITESKRHEARIEQLATRDALTGLPNRALLHDRLTHAIAAGRREHGLVATMFIDVDRFKTINDSLGHHVGDSLLNQMAGRLAGCVRADDTVARPGGDEFVVVAARLADADGAAQIARKILECLSRPYVVGGHQLVTSCSIGISLFPGDGENIDVLLKHADTAMYHAKESGGNAYRFFSAEMNARAVERLLLENDLRRALECDELSLYFQPVVEFASGKVRAAEALARWHHPQRGLVPPERFFAFAEETGLIDRLGEWALAAACKQAREWQVEGQPPLVVAVNVSAGQLRGGRAFAQKVAAILADSGLPPACLELEITESVLVDHIESNVEALGHIAALGTRIVVDDFGTGYSSLSYLKRLPIHGLKIDRSFVRDVVDDPDDAAIVRAVVSLARSLQLTTTAEGIETEAQLEVLRNFGCDSWQGFLYGQAVGAREFEARYLRDAGRRRDA
jgi:diguanylate cyclase (GGDEF)-like protein/PAS domain S-box-containing protein